VLKSFQNCWKVVKISKIMQCQWVVIITEKWSKWVSQEKNKTFLSFARTSFKLKIIFEIWYTYLKLDNFICHWTIVKKPCFTGNQGTITIDSFASETFCKQKRSSFLTCLRKHLSGETISCPVVLVPLQKGSGLWIVYLCFWALPMEMHSGVRCRTNNL
jgi:hypothetical protein